VFDAVDPWLFLTVLTGLDMPGVGVRTVLTLLSILDIIDDLNDCF